MNFKKIMAVFAASVMVCLSALTVYAEDSEEDTAIFDENYETITSKDSVWDYSLRTDSETKEEFACIEKYNAQETEIDIPDEIDGHKVRMLGNYAFYENTNITKMNISENISYFGDFPFFGCTSLKEFEVDEDNKIYTAEDGVLISKDKISLICYPPAKTETEYTVPDGVAELYPSAFAVCSNLKKVNFPDSLEVINLYCFAECTSLNNVVVPDKVTELSMFAFCGCTSLTDIKLPDTMYEIGAGAFFECTSLNSIEFPVYLKEIGQCAFVSTGFTEIEIPVTVQEIGYSAFGYTADTSGQLVAMSNFTVKGVEGSMAQSYCGENENINFEKIAVETTDTSGDTDSGVSETTAESADNNDESSIKPGIIIGWCAFAGVIIIVVIIITVKTRKTSASDIKKNEITDTATDTTNETENKENE